MGFSPGPKPGKPGFSFLLLISTGIKFFNQAFRLPPFQTPPFFSQFGLLGIMHHSINQVYIQKKIYPFANYHLMVKN